jgi:hypothetical protein
MIVQGVSIREMLDQSVTVLTKPSVQTFEEFEKRGGQREAFVYVGVATAISAVVGLLFGLLGGIAGAIGALLTAVLSVVIGYFIFSYVLYLMGKQQGGTGTQNEVFYTTALYIAPIQAISGVLGAIPIVNILALPISLLLAIYSAYLGYLAARSSMNLGQNQGIITVVVAFLATWVITGLIVGTVVAAIVAAVAAGGGAR